MVDASPIGMATAFAAGIVSFMSPCVLPLVPAYLSYVGARPAESGAAQPGRRATVAMAALFVLGFGTVFVALGSAATAAGGLLQRFRYEANVVGGFVIIAFGLLMLGLMRDVGFLQRDMRPGLRSRAQPAGAFALGVAFGFGWTPCIGPVLGAILTYSAMQGAIGSSLPLLVSYAAGLGLPFLLSAAFLRESLVKLKRFRRAGPPLQFAAGIVMVLFGLAMVTDKLSVASYWLLEVFPVLARLG